LAAVAVVVTALELVELVVPVVVVLVSPSLLVVPVRLIKVLLVEMDFGRAVSPIHRLLVVVVVPVKLVLLRPHSVLVVTVEMV
jgi:hypothetical protein